MKKRLLALIICSVIVLGMFAGCGQQQAAPAPVAPTTPDASAAQDYQATAEEVNWPTRPVTIIVPLLAGGDTDFYARTYAPLLAEKLGQPFNVVNVDGAAGTVGSTQVHMSNPDGYTVLFFHTGTMFTNILTETTELNHHDFAMSNVAIYCDATILVASAQSGITDAADFLERAHANPRSINVATTIPAFSFFALRMMEIAGGFEVNAVDVGGAGAMVASLLGGHTEMAVAPYAIFRQYIETGEMVPIMVSSETRNPNFPDVPTVEEMGLTGASIGRAYFFAFPPGTDEGILRRLSDTVGEIQQDPVFAQAIRESFDIEPFFLPMEEALPFMDRIWDDMAQHADQLLPG